MMMPIERIMVYLDGSEASILAVRYAIVVAARLGAEIHALSVLNTRALSDLVQAHIFLESEREEYRNELLNDGMRYLNHAVEMGKRKGVVVHRQSVQGSIAAAIQDKIAELHVDLFVMGPPPRIRSRRDSLYDELEMTMRTLDCSVLIARDEVRIEKLYNGLI
jgi:nucleotide-binding universal stress UspA family protein